MTTSRDRHLKGRSIAARWEAALRRAYAGNRDGTSFAFHVSLPGGEGATVIVHAFFRSGGRYCCPDPICNWDLIRGLWRRLRPAMVLEGLDHLPPVRIVEWRVTVEKGAVFHSGRAESRGRRTEAAWSYRVGPFAEPDTADSEG